MSEKLTIGRLAWLANVNVETIRYYQRRGLLNTPDKPQRGYRYYPEGALKRLQFIKQAQTLGFSLDEIKSFSEFDITTDCFDMRVLLEKKSAFIDQRLSELQKIQETLKGFLCSCNGMGCNGTCPVIGAMNTPPCREAVIK